MMYGQTVRVIGPNSHQRRDKTVGEGFGESPKAAPLFLTSYTNTLPSYRPTHNKELCCGWKSRHITPLSVVNAYSGCDGFFRE
jgi:hypothetical protein